MFGNVRGELRKMRERLIEEEAMAVRTDSNLRIKQ